VKAEAWRSEAKVVEEERKGEDIEIEIEIETETKRGRTEEKRTVKKWASFPLVKLVKAEEGDHKRRREERRGESRERERVCDCSAQHFCTASHTSLTH